MDIDSRLDSLVTKYCAMHEDFVFEYSLSENDCFIAFKHLVVPEEVRGQGIGTDFMQELIGIADEFEWSIAIVASDQYGMDIERLVGFYKKFGFVETGKKVAKNQYNNVHMEKLN